MDTILAALRFLYLNHTLYQLYFSIAILNKYLKFNSNTNTPIYTYRKQIVPMVNKFMKN